MTKEEQRVKIINANSAKVLESLLEAFENKTLDEDEFLAETYARLVTASILGFSPSALSEDAEAAADRLLALTEEATDGA
jgi:hypothetical protein